MRRVLDVAAKDASPGDVNMPTRFWLVLVLSMLAGIAVLLAKPTGRKAKSSAPWRGQIKPPAPPPECSGRDSFAVLKPAVPASTTALPSGRARNGGLLLRVVVDVSVLVVPLLVLVSVGIHRRTSVLPSMCGGS
jgi:hypothetical protein